LSDTEQNPQQPPPDQSVAPESTSGDAGSVLPPSIVQENASFTAPPPQGVLPGSVAPGQQAPLDPRQLPPEIRYAHLPPALRVPWGWLDIFLLVLFSIAVLLVMSVGFAILYGLTGHDPRTLSATSPAMIYVAVILQAILDAIILAYMLGLMRWRYHSSPWRALGWEPLPDGKFGRGSTVMGLIFGGILLSFVVAAASQLFPPKSELPVEQIMHDHRAAILFMVMAVLVAPVVEETLFRGFLYPVAARSFGVPAGIVITGTLFGLLHASQLSGGPWLVVLIIFVGCVFTWIRAKTNTVLASFIVHTAYNGIQVVGLLVATHGLTKAIPHT
jgi:membrane protease YdiL (CAAX protease family)